MSEQNTTMVQKLKYVKPNELGKILEEIKSQLTDFVKRKSKEMREIVERHIHEIQNVDKIYDTYILVVKEAVGDDIRSILGVVEELDSFIETIDIENNTVYHYGQKVHVWLFNKTPDTKSYRVIVKRNENDDSYIAEFVVQFLRIKDVVVYDIALLGLDISEFWT